MELLEEYNKSFTVPDWESAGRLYKFLTLVSALSMISIGFMTIVSATIVMDSKIGISIRLIFILFVYLEIALFHILGLLVYTGVLNIRTTGRFKRELIVREILES